MNKECSQMRWNVHGIVTAATIGLSVSANAAVIGFHDSSDPVKTLGWVCQTNDVKPVTVSMYAITDSGARLLDSQVANKRRDDLSGICPDGVAHAFRFSDYAARGAEVYDSATPVGIRVVADTADGPVALAGTPRLVSFAPVGIWDAGLINGRWRTDHDNPEEGTKTAPLLLGDCALTATGADDPHAIAGGGFDAASGCRYGLVISPASNASSSDRAWPERNFWAMIANVENSFENPLCVDGPPGQSRAIRHPGAGELFGVIALADNESSAPTSRKMHLVLNSSSDVDCRTKSYGIPHLSFGAQADRGNGGVITYLNSAGAKTMLRFGMTLMDIADRRSDAFDQPQPGDTRSSQAQFVVEAVWGGKKRWLIVQVLPDPHLEAAMGGNVDTRVSFSWHLVNSFLYPGAAYTFKSASVLSTQCAAHGIKVATMDRNATYYDPLTRDNSRREYAIDLQKAFDCLTRLATWGPETMPAHRIPITGVHFGIGQDDVFYHNGVATAARSANAIWVAVDGVRVE
jgi:hypothetical protein